MSVADAFFRIFDLDDQYDIEINSLCHVSFLPCLAYVEDTGLHVDDCYSQLGPGSKAAVDSLLLWAECLRDAAEVEDWEDREVGPPENEDLFCSVVCGAFHLYISRQLSASKTHPQLCCQSRKSQFVSSVTPSSLMDDEHFSIAALSYCGGWIMVDGGPACRQDVEMLMSVLDGEENELDFLAFIDCDLLRKNPFVIQRHPFVLQYLPRLRKDASLFEALVALDFRLLAEASRTIWEDGKVIATAATRAAREVWQQGNVSAELDRASAALLGRPSLNSRLRRLTSELAHCLVHSKDKETLHAASRIVLHCGRGSSAEAARPETPPCPSSPRSHCCTGAATPPPRCVLESSPVDEDIRLANEAARAAKLSREKRYSGPRKCKIKSHKARDLGSLPAAGTASPKGSLPVSPGSIRPAVPLLLSTKPLECEDSVAEKVSRKKEKRTAKKTLARDEKVAHRTQVAELFGLASPA